MTTAAAIIIGDEILTGKVSDTNTPLLVALFHEAGVELRRVVTIADDLDQIADEVRRCAAAHDVVVTSGGIGPTHDDRTIEGVALAFGVPVVREPELESMIRTFWGSRCTEDALRMADVPRGARLVSGGDGLLPAVAVENVYLLPGIPELFRAKLGTLRRNLTGTPSLLGSVYLRSDESGIAPHLRAVDAEFADVKVGSYPRLHDAEFRIWITLEAARAERVEAAIDRLLELVAPNEVVRVERP